MKRLYSVLILFLLSFAGLAQNSISVQAPNLVASDEQFNLTFIIEGEDAPSSFEWECPDDFQLVWGPQKGSSTSISIINGKKTKSSQVTYTYVLLPKKTGMLQIPSANAKVKNATLTSVAQAVEVVSGSNPQSSGSSSSHSSGQDNQSPDTVSSDNLFMKLVVSKSRAVVGEILTATLKLYQNANVVRFEDAKFPTFSGFWNQEIQSPTNIEFQREKVGDRIFNSAVLRSWQIIPQQAGDLKIEPAELVCLVNVRAPSSSGGSIFDSFFQDDYRTIRKRVIAPGVTVKVAALPAGAPSSFCGGVGSFRMTASWTRDSLKTHDAASLKVTVTGRGNTALLEAPKINFPPDFEVYDVKTADIPQGKTFEYPFIPRSHGEFSIGSVEYSYYDIDARKYVTLKSRPMALKVSRGNETESAPSTGGQLVQSNRKDVRDLGSDIRFITTKSSGFRKTGEFFVWSPLFWIIAVVLGVIALAFALTFRKMSSRKADVAGSRKRAASKMARKRLSRAGEYMEKNLPSAFYEELHQALMGFVSDKLNMDIADMSKENIAATLVCKGAGEGLAKELTDLLDACEFARYSPSEDNGAMRQHFESAAAVISSIDDNMKKKHRNPGAGAALAVAILALASYSLPVSAQSPDSLWTSGVRAFSEERWQDAVTEWSSIAGQGLESPELYCNIADAYYKMGDYARAVVYYERALKLDPSCRDARYNLTFVSGFLQDKIDAVPEFFLSQWMRSACFLLSSDVWAALALVMLALALSCILVFFLSSRRGWRKTGFFSGIAALFLFIFCLGSAAWQKGAYESEDSAVVTRAVVPVKSAPGDGSKDLFVLHEGAKVRILDEVGHWNNIEIADGRQGWAEKTSMEVI